MNQSTIAHQFEFISTKLDDVFLVKKDKFVDSRGTFIKTFNKSAFDLVGLSTDFKESYFSLSNKNVLRGMHFQQEPFGHAKLITVIEGEILDVCVGIGGALNERNKGKFLSVVLSKANNSSLYIPDGYAHGFLCLSESAIVMNHMTSVFNLEYDSGVHYSSFGFSWPINDPIVSNKDQNLPHFASI
jgi:dTDP-4-dehydrorhamnose 3,5-epimerase